jgi:apolipoprotein N-acyltransferase
MFFTQKAYANPYALVCVVVLAGIPFAIPQSLISRAQENQQSVVSVETYFDKSFYQMSDWEEVKNQEMKSAVERALAEDTSVIVLPEDADFSRAFGSADDVLAWLAQRTQGRDVVLVDNSIAKDARHKNVMRTYIYDPESSSLYFFDKKYLVPQGEFLSYLHEGILSAFTSDDGMAAIKRYARLEPGIQSDSMALPNYLPGVLFCFETAVPYAVQKIESIRNPSLVVHPISYAWFTNPYSLEYQLKQMLRVQAVWSGTPIVSAGSMTQSAAYLEDGSVLLGTTVASNRFWVVKRFDF